MFGKLFGKKKKVESAQKYPALTTALERSILSTVGSGAIPSLPSVAQRAFQISTNPNADVDDFVDIIESDEALSSRLLRIANSVFYMRNEPTTSIPDAVRLIGLEEVKGLLNASTLSSLFPTNNRHRQYLWTNNIATAIIARGLASRFLSSRRSEAFLAGLMHDIGKLLLLQRSPTEYEKIFDMTRSGDRLFPECEGEFFPFDHTEVGLLIAGRWNFSQELCHVIRMHHSPWSEFVPKAFDLTGLVKAADHIAHAAGIGHPKSFFGFQRAHQESLPDVYAYLGVVESAGQELFESMQATVEEEIRQIEEFGGS